MNALQKSAAVTLLSAATVLIPGLSSAMEIQMFDDLAVEDQRDYLNFLVKGSQQILIDEGQQDLAAQVKELFHKTRGERASSGETQFDKELAGVRAYLAKEKATYLTFLPGQVEFALIQMLVRNGIQPSSAFSKALGQHAKTFWPKRPLRAKN